MVDRFLVYKRRINYCGGAPMTTIRAILEDARDNPLADDDYITECCKGILQHIRSVAEGMKKPVSKTPGSWIYKQYNEALTDLITKLEGEK
jgi:hypothetical protein